MKRFAFPPILLSVALVACSTATQQETSTAIATLTPTWTATVTATVTAIPSPTATATSTPTPTPTPLVLPVTNRTPVPDLPYQVITAENVNRLRQVARYGYPRLLNRNPYRLTADGKTIVVGTTLGLEFYDAQTQEKIGGFEVDFLSDFDMTPDGKYFLTLASDTLSVWTRDGQKVGEFKIEAGKDWKLEHPISISPDGSLIAVQRPWIDFSDPIVVDVYRASDGSLIDTVRGEGAMFSGQFLATVFDSVVWLYPTAELGKGWQTRLPKTSLPWCHWSESQCGLSFSPDGTLAAVIRTSRVDVYQVAERKLVREVSGWETDYRTLPSVQLFDGHLVVITPTLFDGVGNIKVKPRSIAVHIASGQWVDRSDDVMGKFPYFQAGKMRIFEWSAEGDIADQYPIEWTDEIALENDGTIRIMDGERHAELVPRGYCLAWYSRHVDLQALQYEPCRRRVDVSEIRIAIYSGEKRQTLLRDFGSDGALTDSFLVLVDYRSFKVFSLDGKMKTEYPSDISLVRVAANNNIALAVGSEGKLLALDIEHGEIIRVASTGTYPYSIALSPDGRFFALYGIDGFIRIWAVLPESAE